MWRLENIMNIEQYKKRLEKHDWHYAFSDDSRVYDRGRKEQMELQAIAKELDPDLVVWKSIEPSGVIR
jgi:hypothetical protein